jgi:hypothetical protein
METEKRKNKIKNANEKQSGNGAQTPNQRRQSMGHSKFVVPLCDLFFLNKFSAERSPNDDGFGNLQLRANFYGLSEWSCGNGADGRWVLLLVWIWVGLLGKMSERIVFFILDLVTALTHSLSLSVYAFIFHRLQTNLTNPPHCLDYSGRRVSFPSPTPQNGNCSLLTMSRERLQNRR